MQQWLEQLYLLCYNVSMRRFKQSRIRKKLKLIDAAKILGVSQPTLSSWESERKSPSLEMLLKLAELYGVTTDYLLGRDIELNANSTKPIPSEILPTLDSKPVWIPGQGRALVNGVDNCLIFSDGMRISFNDVKSQQLGPEIYAESPTPLTKPIPFAKLSDYTSVWIEPVSKDSDFRQALRGRYQIQKGFVENDCGNKFSFSTYGATWFAFEINE